MKTKFPTKYFWMFFAFLLGLHCQVSALESSTSVAIVNIASASIAKWNPGHYILLYPKQSEPRYFNAVMSDLRENPIFRGVQKKYFWNKLEPTKGVYDFSEIRSDLANLAQINRQLVLSLQAESFITYEKLVPDYLQTDEYEGGVYPINTGRGFNVAYYNVKVQDRLVALVKALGREFDHHPNLEAINFEETSPGRTEPEWHRAYIKKYIEGMMTVAIAAKKSFPQTVVIQYVNYPESSLPTVMQTLLHHGIGMGGPDTVQNNKFLAQGVYSYYPKAANELPIGIAVDYNNYQSSVGGSGPMDRPSIESIHRFAVGALKPNYMFWLRRTKEPSNGSNYWSDVLSYFQGIYSPANPSGGLNANCPRAVSSCS